MKELFMLGAIQPPAGADRLHLFFADADFPFAQQQVGRVARHQSNNDKGADADQDDHDNALQDAAGDVGKHGGRTSVVSGQWPVAGDSLDVESPVQCVLIPRVHHL